MGNKKYQVEILCENIMDRLLKEGLIPSVAHWIITVFKKMYVPQDISKYFAKQTTMKKSLWLNLFGNCDINTPGVWDSQ